MEDRKVAAMAVLHGLGVIYIILAAWGLLSGCKTVRYVTVPEVHYRDSVTTHWRVDSVFTIDSVFVNQYIKGDTVYQDRSKVRYVYRDRLRTDTVIVEKRDSVPVVSKTTEWKWRTHWYDAVCRRFTCAVLLAVAAIVVAWLVKKKLKR